MRGSRAELWEIPTFGNPADREESEGVWLSKEEEQGNVVCCSHVNEVFQEGQNSHLCQIVLKIQEKYNNAEFGHVTFFNELNKSHLSRWDRGKTQPGGMKERGEERTEKRGI